jgi:hypothetical protein
MVEKIQPFFLSYFSNTFNNPLNLPVFSNLKRIKMMKKSGILMRFLSTLILISPSVVLMSQTMQLKTARGVDISDAETLATVSAGDSEKFLYTDSLVVQNLSDQTIRLKVKKTDLHLVQGTFHVFRALEQNIAVNETITPNAFDLEAGATLPKEAAFIGTYAPQNSTDIIIGTTTVIYTFLSLDAGDRVLDSVYVVYSFSNTSISPLNTEGEYLYNQEIFINCGLAEVNEYPVLLYNHSSENVNFRVVKTPEYVEEGQEFYFKFGNVVYPQEENSSSGDGFPIVPGDTLQGENGFFAYFNPNSLDSNLDFPRVKYRFFNRLSGSDSETITLIYNPSGVGFEEIEGFKLSAPYPNPATEFVMIDHPLTATNNPLIKIYNASGQLVLTENIKPAATSSKIDLQSLCSGIYFLSLEIDQQTLGVEKLIVKKNR